VRLIERPSKAQLFKWSLAENLQREDLKPSETGEWLSRMLGEVDEDSGVPLWTSRSLAEEIGKPPQWVSLAMTLTRAPETVQRAVDSGECPMETGALVGTLPAALREGAAMEMVHGPMGAMSRDQARAWVGEMYRRDLRKAEFSTDEVGLADRPACTRCEWWGGGRDDVAGKASSTVCLNPACFLEKQKAAVMKRAEERGAQLSLFEESGSGLEIMKTSNADLPMKHGSKALLTIDVWEHAYYIDFRNARPNYISTFLDSLVNWEFVAQNMAS
jgi:hypothetical protein